jgi:hypothetical protein
MVKGSVGSVNFWSRDIVDDPVHMTVNNNTFKCCTVYKVHFAAQVLSSR